ncbi:MAG: VOC family protein [Alphaproteobacteria bacterium]
MGLKLSHTFIAVADLDKVVPFYTDILGFEITDRGHITEETEAVFMSQDPANHHQIALANSLKDGRKAGLQGHVAFRMESLDELRALKKHLQAKGIAIGRELSHGNAWSLYVTDPEGNGVECFVDTPFHVSQPQGKPTNIDLDDAALLAKTRDDFGHEPEFGTYADWQDRFRARLEK